VHECTTAAVKARMDRARKRGSLDGAIAISASFRCVCYLSC
jgi:hypothetical protein